MTYSNSTHFSEQLSYKILFILSYGSKDMNLSRFAYLQEFSGKKKQKNWAGPEPDWRRIITVTRLRRTAVGGSGPRPVSAPDLNKNRRKGRFNPAAVGIRTRGCRIGAKGSDQSGHLNASEDVRNPVYVT
jgi:hypothetical protein